MILQVYIDTFNNKVPEYLPEKLIPFYIHVNVYW